MTAVLVLKIYDLASVFKLDADVFNHFGWQHQQIVIDSNSMETGLAQLASADQDAASIPTPPIRVWPKSL